MKLTKLANQVRHNYYFSLVASRMAVPIQRVCGYLDRQIRMKVWINGGKVSYDGVELKFPRDVGVSYSTVIYWNGYSGYEPNTWRVLRHFLKKSNHFIDIGSNIGLYSVLAKKINPNIVVDAFEPVPSIFQKNVLFHQVNDCGTSGLWNLALSNQDGQAMMYMPLECSSIEEEATATLRTDSWQFRRAQKAEIQVTTTKLDTFFGAHGKHPPITMKIDVEDHEASVLTGACETLSTERPTIVCEILPRTHGNVETFDFLTECEYSIFAICKEGLFRMTRDDLGRPRSVTNFVLLHDSMISKNQIYIAYDNRTDDLLM